MATIGITYSGTANVGDMITIQFTAAYASVNVAWTAATQTALINIDYTRASQGTIYPAKPINFKSVMLNAFNKEDPTKLHYAAGFYIEAFPALEERDIAILEQIVLNLPKFHELYKAEGFDLDELLDQLRGPYDIDIVREIDPKAYCPCSKDRMVATLATLKTEDLKDLRKDNKDLEAICDFCRNKYTITMQDLDDLINERRK